MKNQNKSISLGALLFLALTPLFLGACGVNFNAPEDEALQACTAGKIGKSKNSQGTDISCEALESGTVAQKFIPVRGPAKAWPGVTCNGDNCFKVVESPRVEPTPSNLPGLIVMVEAGTFEANQTNMASSFQGMVSNDFPEGLRPHLRMFMSNLTKAFLERTIQDNGDMYGHIYFIKGEGDLKRIFLQTLSKATSIHPQVDLLLVGHGSPGEFILNSALQSPAPQNLKSQELIDYAKTSLSDDQRGRVRAIFQTHCYVAKQPSGGKSMYQAYQEIFPNAYYYGGVGINYYPLHRDMVMFENFYRTKDFLFAFQMANDIMLNAATGPRSAIVYPVVMGKGCVSMVGIKKCQTQSGPIATRKISSNDYANAMSYHSTGTQVPIAQTTSQAAQQTGVIFQALIGGPLIGAAK